MRKLLVVVLFLNFILIAKSQSLTVEGTAPDLYVTHTVAPKENFYSIARLYNQPPKSIASYNKIVMEKGLTIGQKIKIPLNDQNFNVSNNADPGETLIPITHIVGKNETLFKIAGNNNETAELIRKWNNLSSDNIAPGTPLTIGHLKVKGAQSSVSSVKNNETVVNSDVPATSKPVETTEAKQPATEAKKEDLSVSVNNTSDLQKSKKQESPQSENTASSTTITTESVKDTALAVIPEETKQPAEITSQPAKEKPVKQQEISLKETGKTKRTEQTTSESVNSSEGAFARLFDQTASQKTANTKSGEAATFKSTSGWQDKKYYVLISNVAPGTILKISSAENKVVYAKVLGSMPEMKENDGLLLRISNAAASSLGIIDPKFPVKISYYQ